MPVTFRSRGSLTAALLVVASGGLTAVGQPAQAAETLSIAQIQGTGSASPYAGDPVQTGPAAVTAVYGQGSSSELRGFVIQTPGTGGRARDLSRASDAVFVFMGSTPFEVDIGDVVSVGGTVSEFPSTGAASLTQIAGAVSITRLAGDYPAVRPVTGTAWEDTADERENLESMLYFSRQKFTVSDPFPLLRFGELGLTAGALPVQPTDEARPGSSAAAAQAAENLELQVNLDDGSNRGFTRTATLPARPLPFLSATQAVAVGDTLRLTEPVIVDWRNNIWKFNPTRVVQSDDEVATINHRPAAPRPRVGGAIQVASFNVLNYFTTTGQGGPGCAGGNLDTEGSYNVTFSCDARGAWDAEDLGRQQAKIVAAINRLDASVVGLMEIENSVKLGEPADEATATLVTALNTAAGYRQWDYVASRADQLQDVADQDFITNAIIFQRLQVKQRDLTYALGAESGADGAFANARTPIAAAFTHRRGGNPMLVVVNHFKSKSDSADAFGDNDPELSQGQGAFNGDRVRQAQALRDWVPSVQAATRTQATALIGDFNAYTQEDPLTTLYAAGYRNAASQRQYSYVFAGLSGSLDHVLVNRPAARRLTKARVWNINSGQSQALEYSTYKTTSTDLYRPNALRSSDHDPVIAGFRR